MIAEDATLDEIRIALAPEIAVQAVFDGWGDEALNAAAEMADIDPAVARLAFKGGTMTMITAWIAATDAAMEAEFADGRLGNMPIRERIRLLVEFRLEHVAPLREALRRALAIQAMPQNVAATLKLGWQSADTMWRLAGDTATDYNHYTKRAILGSLYAATLAIFVEDESDDWEETRAFLARRIENVMQFEKAKAQLLGQIPGKDESFDLMRFLGRMRYPNN